MDISKESLDEIDDQTDLSNLKKLEAALFISGRFLNIQELVALTDINPILLKKSLNDLDDKYKNSGIEVIKIRGNKAYDHIKKFVELTLINKKKIGHTAELKLNENFYEYFHLNSDEEIIKKAE